MFGVLVQFSDKQNPLHRWSLNKIIANSCKYRILAIKCHRRIREGIKCNVFIQPLLLNEAVVNEY